MDKQQLRPCPFCGGEAEIKQYRSDGIRIRCRECSVKIEQRCMRLTLDRLEELMVADWNKRMPQPPSASDERDSAEGFAFASTNEPSGLLRHWWRKGYDAGRAMLAAAPQPSSVDAAEQKPVAFALQWPEDRHLGRLCLAVVTDDEKEAQDYASTCTDVTILPLYAAPSPAAGAEWLAEAERMVDDYGSAVANAETFAGKAYHAAMREARAALLAHLKNRT